MTTNTSECPFFRRFRVADHKKFKLYPLVPLLTPRKHQIAFKIIRRSATFSCKEPHCLYKQATFVSDPGDSVKFGPLRKYGSFENFVFPSIPAQCIYVVNAEPVNGGALKTSGEFFFQELKEAIICRRILLEKYNAAYVHTVGLYVSAYIICGEKKGEATMGLLRCLRA